jgi:hypothetical protein
MRIPASSRETLLDLLSELGAHSVWNADYVHDELGKCGVQAQVDVDGKSLSLGNHKVSATVPEWGESGIYAPSLLSTIIESEGFENSIESDMTGRGFRHKHLLQQLASLWGIDKTYL